MITHIFFDPPVERVYIAEIMCYLYNTNRSVAYVLGIAPKDMGNDKAIQKALHMCATWTLSQNTQRPHWHRFLGTRAPCMQLDA